MYYSISINIQCWCISVKYVDGKLLALTYILEQVIVGYSCISEKLFRIKYWHSL